VVRRAFHLGYQQLIYTIHSFQGRFSLPSPIFFIIERFALQCQ
jgi:hypothetical protein